MADRHISILAGAAEDGSVGMVRLLIVTVVASFKGNGAPVIAAEVEKLDVILASIDRGADVDDICVKQPGGTVSKVNM